MHAWAPAHAAAAASATEFDVLVLDVTDHTDSCFTLQAELSHFATWHADHGVIAFLCHHGGRSAQAAEHFRQQGFSQVYNVVGGIEAWAASDPAVPRY